jgi:hypothetical protein
MIKSAGRSLPRTFWGLLQDLTGAGHHLLGDADESAIFVAMLRVALFGGHARNGLHAPLRCPGAMVEGLQPTTQRLSEVADEASDDPHGIPQERVVGGVVDVRIESCLLDPLFRLIQKVGDGLPSRIEENALTPELRVRKTDLQVGSSAPGSPFFTVGVLCRFKAWT